MENCRVACDRLAGTIIVLVNALQNKAQKAAFGGFDATTVYKALTISHEMLYDANAVQYITTF